MEEKDLTESEETLTKRPLLGAIAVPVIACLLFKYGYLFKI